jgi:EAL domain-containing protein (putative c-di-GMP-specific phosphodiesterase class I)
LKEFAKWQKMRPGLTLSFNLCDKELLSPKLLTRFVEWSKEAGVSSSGIIFEVRDQSRVRMSPSWWRILQEYTAAGFGLCLDDYGSESSLFGTLAYGGFSQAKVKVDESKGLSLTPAPQAGKNVQYCAKGLQTKFDKKALVKAGFHMAQGYAVSRPLDYADVEMLLT